MEDIWGEGLAGKDSAGSVSGWWPGGMGQGRPGSKLTGTTGQENGAEQGQHAAEGSVVPASGTFLAHSRGPAGSPSFSGYLSHSDGVFCPTLSLSWPED